MTICNPESRNAFGGKKLSRKKATLSNSECPARCLVPELMALLQQKDSGSEAGREEALTLNCAL